MAVQNVSDISPICGELSECTAIFYLARSPSRRGRRTTKGISLYQQKTPFPLKFWTGIITNTNR
jgi:hypothetical protein